MFRRPRRGTACPPSAAAKSPFRSRSAPVKAPFTWPKSSLSRSVSGKAAQFRATNSPRRRVLSSWIARARSSLPVPVSPAISTEALERAARRARLRRLSRGRLAPTIDREAVLCGRRGARGRRQPVELLQDGRGLGSVAGAQHDAPRAGRPQPGRFVTFFGLDSHEQRNLGAGLSEGGKPVTRVRCPPEVEHHGIECGHGQVEGVCHVAGPGHVQRHAVRHDTAARSATRAHPENRSKSHVSSAPPREGRARGVPRGGDAGGVTAGEAARVRPFGPPVAGRNFRRRSGGKKTGRANLSRCRDVPAGRRNSVSKTRTWLALAAALSTGCAWVSLDPGAEAVSLRDSDSLGGCKRLGKTHTRTTRRARLRSRGGRVPWRRSSLRWPATRPCAWAGTSCRPRHRSWTASRTGRSTAAPEGCPRVQFFRQKASKPPHERLPSFGTLLLDLGRIVADEAIVEHAVEVAVLILVRDRLALVVLDHIGERRRRWCRRRSARARHPGRSPAGRSSRSRWCRGRPR